MKATSIADTRPAWLTAAAQNFGHSLRQTFSQPYGRAGLKADFLAGIVVGIIALPLSMALGIATGVPPEHGLYTAIIAGIVAAILGGAPRQVTGPTAAFVVLLVPVTNRFGLGGLAIASLMAGVWLLLMGLLRLGGLVRYVPTPVTLGFTGGIAIVIATLQLKDFLGLRIVHMPESYIGKVQALMAALPTAKPADAAMGLATLATLLLWPRLTKKIPAPLVALTLASIVGYSLSQQSGQFAVATIQTRFSYVVDGVRYAGIPQTPPWPTLAWLTQGPSGTPLVLDWALFRALLPASFAIAMLAAIESLLAAVVADRMGNTRHNSDAELLGVGVANIVSPFFGGFAATGAIARTAANIRSGARSPVAAVLHAFFVLATMLLMAPLLGHMPMASLAALLLVVAWNMGEPAHIVRAVRSASREDALVLLVCLSLTVIFDMVVSIGVGVVLAALLFSRNMGSATRTRVTTGRDPDSTVTVPPGVWLCDVTGPLFFGAAEPALQPIKDILDPAARGAVVVDLSQVPVLDATGLASLQGIIRDLNGRETMVLLVPPPTHGSPGAFERNPWAKQFDRLAMCGSRHEALARASAYAAATQAAA